jgi:hypothetical protein
MQRKLDSYFKVAINHDTKNKKCFIYDPENNIAYFTTEPNASDIFVSKKSGVKLYTRPYTLQPDANTYPVIITTESIPLLKSNLQKTIRRADTINALHTTLALLQLNPNELFRRLAIIYIEDVCLNDSYSIIVWLMMSSAEYALAPNDYTIVLNIVANLCCCQQFYEEPETASGIASGITQYSHESLQGLPNHSQLLALYYRSLYGGMKSDMDMLLKSIAYYSEASKLEVCGRITFHLAVQSAEQSCVHLVILDEAIDFHPFPRLLLLLSQSTFLKKELLREIIWHAESGYNVRKPVTMRNASLYKARGEWTAIEKQLKDIRHTLLNA